MSRKFTNQPSSEKLISQALPQDFLQGDLKVEHYRHIVMATKEQLEVLSRATEWYIDTTPKLVKWPFTRLLSISAYLNASHLPLVFCFMSHLRQKDFKAVLECVKSALPSVCVGKIVPSFDSGHWAAVQEVFPNVLLQGCSYNFGDAIQEKVKDMGLEDELEKNEDFHNYVRRLKSLPFLHPDHITPEFMFLRTQGEDASVRGLVNFVDDKWILNAEWGVTRCSVFHSLIRTKENCESWKKRVRHKARCGQCHFYQLIGLLYREAMENVMPNSGCITGNELRIVRCQSSKSFQAAIEAIWKSCEATDLTVDEITTKISLLLE